MELDLNSMERLRLRLRKGKGLGWVWVWEMREWGGRRRKGGCKDEDEDMYTPNAYKQEQA